MLFSPHWVALFYAPCSFKRCMSIFNKEQELTAPAPCARGCYCKGVNTCYELNYSQCEGYTTWTGVCLCRHAAASVCVFLYECLPQLPVRATSQGLAGLDKACIWRPVNSMWRTVERTLTGLGRDHRKCWKIRKSGLAGRHFEVWTKREGSSFCVTGVRVELLTS